MLHAIFELKLHLYFNRLTGPFVSNFDQTDFIYMPRFLF